MASLPSEIGRVNKLALQNGLVNELVTLGSVEIPMINGIDPEAFAEEELIPITISARNSAETQELDSEVQKSVQRYREVMTKNLTNEPAKLKRMVLKLKKGHQLPPTTTISTISSSGQLWL